MGRIGRAGRPGISPDDRLLNFFSLQKGAIYLSKMLYDLRSKVFVHEPPEIITSKHIGIDLHIGVLYDISSYMRNYELSLLLNPDLGEEKAQEALQQVAAFFQECEGIVQSQNLLGKRSLPAPVLKQGEAYLASLTATASPEKVGLLEQKLKGSKDVLRFLLTVKKYRAVKTKAPRVRKIQKSTLREPSSEPKMELADIDKKIEEMIEKSQNI